jgi:hypothetical protein
MEQFYFKNAQYQFKKFLKWVGKIN